MANGKQLKNGKRMKSGKKQMAGKPARRTKVNAATNALVPGTGAVPPVPYGASQGASLLAFDATHPSHMPLPRSVGPYSVTRTTMRFKSNSRVVIFGTFNYSGSAAATTQGTWSNVVAVSDVDASLAINAPNNAMLHSAPDPSSDGTCVPSAYTVQIMNPTALQSANGMCYMGVAKTQLPLKGVLKTWDALSNELISYMAPRIVASAKLSLNGIKISSYPMNMSSLANFDELTFTPDETVTTLSATNNAPDLNGMAPIFVVNSESQNLEYLVTVEWRTRFNITNVASSTHKHYTATPDNVFDKVVRAASNLGHGAIDIADTISRFGQAASTIRGALGGARNSLPMLVD